MSYGNGIKLTAGFDVGAKTPLDSKSVVQTIAERDAFVTDNLVYEGLEVYVKDTGHKYRYNGTSWIDLDTQSGSESGTGEGLTTEQANQLTTAYEHSQTPHVSADDIPTNISDLTNDSGFITSIPEEYITETELNAKGYLTSHQDISGLQPKTDNNLTTTSKEVVGAINEVKSSVDGITVPTKTSDLTNDSGFITSIPSEYITETELETKGYLTEHQSLTDYAKKTDIPDVSDFLTEVPAEYVTDTKLSTELDKKVNKEVGKGLSTNDLTNELITKINSSATEAFVTNAIANAQLDGGDVDLSGYATVDALNLKADLTHTHDQYLTEVPDEYVTETELTAKGYLTSHQDISNLQPKTDDSLTTTDKTVTGAINEVNGNLLDTVGFSADYKNIILNRKSGLNPYTIPIASIINNISLTELKDIDGTDIGNGKTIVYNSVTQKHKYVNATLTDELVKMDSTTDAHYLADLIDKSTIVNDNGVLKVKKLDGQEVTITEINYLKGLTMNVMDLVSAFANGGVKVWETPVNTYSDLETLDRSTFIDEVSYIVYVLIDETHSNAKTTYLCTKTSTTFFGNADSQRNFITNPIDLANEVTGKLDNSHIDIDNLWTLLTINDTYKTLTTNNEAFGTHGAKAMYDELTTAIGGKANTTDLTTHTNNTDIHVTTTDKAKWDKVDEKVDKTSITTTIDITSTNAQVPTAKAVNELNLRGTLIDQSVIDKYGTEIIKYPFGRWYIDGNEIAGKFSDMPWGSACIIDITSPITSTRNPWDNTWAYRNYSVQTIENKGTFVRQLESRGTPGVLLDTGWQKVCTTTVADVPNTVIVSENTNVKLNSNCYYTVINGVCYVTLWGFTCTEEGQHVVNSKMPKTRLTMQGICTHGQNGKVGACAFVSNEGGTVNLYIEANTINEPLYGSFSYPVAES